MKTPDFDFYAQDCLDFLQRLIQTPSVNGRENEGAVAQLIQAEADKLGLPSKVLAKDESHPNIFVGESLESENLLLVAHTDTVPEGTLDKWQHPPFDGVVADGKLFGRGTFDCKAGIATSLYTLKILKDTGQLNKAKFLGSVDEESGADSELGIKYVISQGLQAKGAVYTYGNTDNDSLTIGHRGVVRVWVTCHGESAHTGSLSWQNREKGASALSAMMVFLSELEDISFTETNELFPGYKFTLTPTMISGGSGESMVPDSVKVLIDIRTLPEHNNERVIEFIRELANKLSVGKVSFGVEVKTNIPGILSDLNSDVVVKAGELMREVYGTERPDIKGAGPAFEGHMLIGAGIPTIAGFGALGGGFHSYDEYVEIDSLVRSLEFLTKLALGM